MLVHIFDVMNRFYSHGAGRRFEGADELAEIFKDLK